MMYRCEKVSLSSFWWAQEQPSMSVASRLHTRCVDEWAASRAQDRDWRAVETQRYEDCRLPVSRRRTSSGLHSCGCEATNSECLSVDGQRHRNVYSSVTLTVRLLNSHVVVVFSFCNVKLLLRCCWHLWMRSQWGRLLISHLLTRRWSVN